MNLKTRVSKAPWHKKLEILRILEGLTQKQAAQKCGTDKRIYWNWENGVSKPIKRNREYIAKAFNVSEDELFSDLDKKDSEIK